MLELWKPLQTLENKDERDSLLFDDELFEKYWWNKRLKSFIIFSDANNYYYTKIRSAYFLDTSTNPSKFKIREKENKEIKISYVVDASNQNLLESYVDCSQIFVMNKKNFESFVDINSDEYKKNKKIDNKSILKILENIKKNIFLTPPDLSISNVFINLDENETDIKSLYLSDQKYKKIIDDAKNSIIDLDDKIEENLTNLVSSKNSNSILSKNRYINGINFCLKFLNEYYPVLTDQFLKQQDLGKNFNKNNNNEKQKDMER